MSFGEAMARQLDAVAQLSRPVAAQFKSPALSARGVKARVGYILSPKTGSSVDTVARMAGVTPRTVRAWQKGRTPSKSSKQKIDDIYQRFFGINSHAKASRPRLRKTDQVLTQVSRNKIQLTNADGDSRIWMAAGAWARFVRLWGNYDLKGLDDAWDSIISAWDYPEPWASDLIEDITIV